VTESHSLHYEIHSPRPLINHFGLTSPKASLHLCEWEKAPLLFWFLGVGLFAKSSSEDGAGSEVIDVARFCPFAEPNERAQIFNRSTANPPTFSPFPKFARATVSIFLIK